MLKWNTESKTVLGVLSSLAAGTAAFIALAYIRKGRSAQASPLLPRAVEEQLDRVTSWLDTRFGKAVVDRGMDALQQVLRGSAPDKLMQLLEHVIEPESLEHKKEVDELVSARGSRMTVTPVN